MASETNKQRKFQLDAEEKQAMITLRRIYDDLMIQAQGIRRQMDFEMVKIQVRVGIAHEQVEKGFQRQFSLDDKEFKLIVTDVPEVAETPKIHLK